MSSCLIMGSLPLMSTPDILTLSVMRPSSECSRSMASMILNLQNHQLLCHKNSKGNTAICKQVRASVPRSCQQPQMGFHKVLAWEGIFMHGSKGWHWTLSFKSKRKRNNVVEVEMPTHTSTLKIQIFKNPLKMQGEEKVKKVTNLMAGFNKNLSHSSPKHFSRNQKSWK